MKKILFAVLLCAVLFSGCDLWMSGEYYAVTPHQSASNTGSQTTAEVSSYTQLRGKLEQMVAEGAQDGVIYYSVIDRAHIDRYMETAAKYVMESTPIGAYAVRDISYDIGTNTGKQAVAVTVTYDHSRPEILRIKQASTMADACQIIAGVLENYDTGVTIQVDTYEEMDITQYVQDYVDENPDVCMEMPQVTTSVYPESGTARILEIMFSYQTSREELRKMQQTVEPVFNSAELYVSGDAENTEKYFQLYSFLMERHNYTQETSITPAYHLLRHGVGDSKAFATVYAAMCRRAGLYCHVVTGTREGESWYWNVIDDNGEYRYVDLLLCNKKGKFTTKNQEQMSGYVWDYDLFPENTEELTTEN